MFTSLVGIFGFLRWFVPALMIVGVGTFAWSYVHEYRAMAEEIVVLKSTVAKYDGRLASYHRMIERRDSAINALPDTYRAKVEYWLRHPDHIPKPFDPNHQFDPPMYMQPNALDTEPVPDFEVPDLSGVLPWNWNWSWANRLNPF